MMVMRAGKIHTGSVKKQNDSGAILAVCLFVAAVVVSIGVAIK